MKKIQLNKIFYIFLINKNIIDITNEKKQFDNNKKEQNIEEKIQQIHIKELQEVTLKTFKVTETFIEILSKPQRSELLQQQFQQKPQISLLSTNFPLDPFEKKQKIIQSFLQDQTLKLKVKQIELKVEQIKFEIKQLKSQLSP
jgi:hypothetical protein